ncbi:MAG: bifunctional methylenetetrahydrofolate dehydrogenase/methenyltetrahydrofolate cyclohydrolase FolD [Myxococcales bacterium]|nr:bifunctional methylenetetrahydrofolate dehydrogenase/methenyltetrahydrofolate cyclohydrolase FolD [Myxococcales bacterium]
MKSDEPSSPAQTRILDGKAIAAQVRVEVAAGVSRLKNQGITPGLAVVLVGDDPASQVYVRSKTRACEEVGVVHFDHRLPATIPQAELESLIDRLNDDPRVHGVLLQLPLPTGLDAGAVLRRLDPRKDVDGLLAENVGRLWNGEPRFVPCTPLGVMRLLHEAGTPIAGAHAVVIGRSQLVGKPVAALLLNEHATVTMCHSRTQGLDAIVAAADIVVAALGKPQRIVGAWIKKGATVIDVGINRLPDGRLVGDVDFDSAVLRAATITPVPGGVGPLTIAMLLANTLRAAENTSEPR